MMLTRSSSVSNETNEFRKTHRNDHTFSILPIEVLVLQGYLSVKSISNLDIAICDVDLRILFLNENPE
jgi:hypothetical protein